MSFIQNYVVDKSTNAEIEIRREPRAYSVRVTVVGGKTYTGGKSLSTLALYEDFKDILSTIYKRSVYVYRFLPTMRSEEYIEKFSSEEKYKMPKEVQLFL